jgi:hypothetical protein
MTDNHPVLTTRGYIPAELLTIDDEVISWNESNMMDIRGLEKNQATTNQQGCTQTVNANGCTSTCGQNIMENNQKGTTFTTKMRTKTTMIYPTWNYWKQEFIALITDFKETWKNRKNIWKEYVLLLQNGTNQRKEENGQETTSKTTEKKCSSTTIKSVVGAKNILELDSVTGLPIATVSANFKHYKQTLLNRKSLLASGAEVVSSGIDVKLPVAQNVNIISLLEKKDRRLSQTYNLEVSQTHNFLANGVVVHNCIDLLNQLSEMDVYAPDNGDEGDGSRTIVTEDGLMWNAIWGDDEWEERGSKNGSTVF